MTDPTWPDLEELDDDEEEYDTRPWWQRYRLPLIIAGGIMLFLLLVLPSVIARDQIDTLEDDVSDLKEDLGQAKGTIDANKAALDEANRILVQLGEEPVTVPDVDAEMNDPDPNDPERQDAEVQDPEVNDPDPFDDPEAQDSEFDDPELQELEIQDLEIQDPEIDDPDPNNGKPDRVCPEGTESRTFLVVVAEDDPPIPGHMTIVKATLCVVL